MRYPNKFYIEFDKKPANKKLGISGGQVTMIKNFNTQTVNLSRKENDKRAGIDYQITKLKDYPDMLELELTRKDQLKK